jgi:NADH dehydrogenase (ubiquinone) Fe-S protein 5
MDFTRCLADAELPRECNDFREDYIECLHHRKEMHRVRVVAEAAQKRRAAEAAAKKGEAAAGSGKH